MFFLFVNIWTTVFLYGRSAIQELTNQLDITGVKIAGYLCGFFSSFFFLMEVYKPPFPVTLAELKIHITAMEAVDADMLTKFLDKFDYHIETTCIQKWTYWALLIWFVKKEKPMPRFSRLSMLGNMANMYIKLILSFNAQYFP